MILFVNSIPDDNMIRFSLDKQGKRQLSMGGNTNALPFLGIPKNLLLTNTFCGPKFKQPDLVLPVMPRLIFNEISDPDTSYGALERCLQLVRETGVPVINHPARVLNTMRHQVAETLQGIDSLRVPRTIRCKPMSPEDVYALAGAAEIEPPFIVRVAGGHGGQQMLRVDGDDDYPHLHAFPFDGREFYISQFLDYADTDGFYHKYRIAVIGGQPIARHALVGSEWMVHANTRSSVHQSSFVSEHKRIARIECEFLPGLRGMISTIRERLDLDYFGIDCNISEDGEVTLFEANAAMNLFQNNVPELNPIIDRLRTTTRNLISRRSHMSL